MKVTSFCQNFKNQKWVNIAVDKENNIKLENAILNKAKKIKIRIKLKVSSRYNHKVVEQKWQNKWSEKKIFASQIDKNKKILRIRNVSLSIGENTYGTC